LVPEFVKDIQNFLAGRTSTTPAGACKPFTFVPENRNCDFSSASKTSAGLEFGALARPRGHVISFLLVSDFQNGQRVAFLLACRNSTTTIRPLVYSKQSQQSREIQQRRRLFEEIIVLVSCAGRLLRGLLLDVGSTRFSVVR